MWWFNIHHICITQMLPQTQTQTEQTHLWKRSYFCRFDIGYKTLSYLSFTYFQVAQCAFHVVNIEQWVVLLLGTSLPVKHSWYWTQVLGGCVSHRHVSESVCRNASWSPNYTCFVPHLQERLKKVCSKLEFVVFLGAVTMDLQFSYHLTSEVILNILSSYCFVYFYPNMYLQSFGQLFR